MGNQKGITMLFITNNYGRTPLQIACHRHERDVVMGIVEDTLNFADIPINTGEALVTAAANAHVHVECVYLLLRREPDVLVQLLSESHNNKNDDDDGGGGGNYNDGNDVVDDDDDDGNGDGDGDGDSDNNSDGGIVDSKNNGVGTRKRKKSG